MTRAEHLQWAKDRALEYIPGNLAGAMTSFISDIGKWDGGDIIEPRTLQALTPIGMMDVASGNAEGLKQWIEGWN